MLHRHVYIYILYYIQRLSNVLSVQSYALQIINTFIHKNLSPICFSLPLLQFTALFVRQPKQKMLSNNNNGSSTINVLQRQ